MASLKAVSWPRMALGYSTIIKITSLPPKQAKILVFCMVRSKDTVKDMLGYLEHFFDHQLRYKV